MSSAAVNETTATRPHIEEVPSSNGSKAHTDMSRSRPPREEIPALRQDDSLLQNTLAFMMQQAADNSKVTNALLEKMVNGNGTSKIKTIIQTVVAVVGLSVGIIVYIVTITSSNRDLVKDVQVLQTEKQRLEQTVDKMKEKLDNLEDMYMVEFGRAPNAAGNKDQKKR